MSIETVIAIILGIYIIYSLVKTWVIMASFVFNFGGIKWQKIKKWALRSHGWHSVNGIGARLYGHSKDVVIGNDTSFETASFLCFIFIPLVPLYEYRVIFRGGHRTFLGRKENFTVLNTFEIDNKNYPIFKMFVTPIALLFCTIFIIFGVYLLVTPFL